MNRVDKDMELIKDILLKALNNISEEKKDNDTQKLANEISDLIEKEFVSTNKENKKCNLMDKVESMCEVRASRVFQGKRSLDDLKNILVKNNKPHIFVVSLDDNKLYFLPIEATIFPMNIAGTLMMNVNDGKMKEIKDNDRFIVVDYDGAMNISIKDLLFSYEDVESLYVANPKNIRESRKISIEEFEKLTIEEIKKYKWYAK